MPRGITLTDGPHMLETPKVAQLIELQRMGYTLNGAFTTSLVRATGRLDGDGDEIVEPDLGAITDHLCVLLRVAEPHASWTPEKVADALTIDSVSTAFEVLTQLGQEGFGEDAPKAP